MISNSVRLLAVRLLTFGACLFFCACSPSPHPENGPIAEDTSQVGDGGGTPETPDQDQQMIKDGWRRGTLTLRIDINQKGAEHTLTPGDSLHGPSETKTEWETTVNAVREQDVLVAPDLTVIVPDTTDVDELRSAYKSAPYFVSDAAPAARISGSLVSRSRWSYNYPAADDFISITRAFDETGVIEDLNITRINPSIFGAGYDAFVEFTVGFSSRSVETMVPKGGGPPVVKNENAERAESLRLMLHPVPNPDQLNNFPYDDSELPDALKGVQKKRDLEMLATLKNIAADVFPVQTELRAGMLTQATKDELVLSYEYAGAKQVPFFMGPEALGTKPEPNSLRVKVVVKTKPVM